MGRNNDKKISVHIKILQREENAIDVTIPAIQIARLSLIALLMSNKMVLLVLDNMHKVVKEKGHKVAVV